MDVVERTRAEIEELHACSDDVDVAARYSEIHLERGKREVRYCCALLRYAGEAPNEVEAGYRRAA